METTQRLHVVLHIDHLRTISLENASKHLHTEAFIQTCMSNQGSPHPVYNWRWQDTSITDDHGLPSGVFYRIALWLICFTILNNQVQIAFELEHESTHLLGKQITPVSISVDVLNFLDEMKVLLVE